MAKNKNHHLVERGNVWYFQKTIKGKRIKKALTESVTEARKMRDHLLDEIRVYGDFQKEEDISGDGMLFGEIAQK